MVHDASALLMNVATLSYTAQTACRLLIPLTHCACQPQHAYHHNTCTKNPCCHTHPPHPRTCTKSAPAANMSTTCCPQLTPPTPMSVSPNCRLSIMLRAVRTKSSAAWRMGAPQTPLVGRSGPRAGDPSWSSTVLRKQREREGKGRVGSAAQAPAAAAAGRQLLDVRYWLELCEASWFSLQSAQSTPCCLFTLPT
jgi:hypothetical protein